MLLAILLFITISVLIAFFAHYFYRCIFPWRYGYAHNIPGPPLQPLVGLMFDLIHLDALALTKQVWKWHNTYNSPMRLKLLKYWGVHIYKAEHFEIILKSRTNITKSPIYWLIEPWLGKGLLTSTHEMWHAQRKMLTPAFHFQILKEFMHVFNRHSAEMVEFLKDKVADNPQEAINMTELLTLTTLDIVCETSMGKQLNALQHSESAYVKAVLNFSEALVYRTLRPWLNTDFIFFNFTSIGRRQWKDIQIMHEFTESVIREREANFEGLEQTGNTKRRLTFLDLLLDLKMKGKMTFEEIREQVDTFMFEGHDTTSTGLMWICYCLGRHLEIQKQVQEEIDNILGTDQYPTAEQLNEMEYLERCIKEAQRIYPSVPTVSRLLDESVEIEEGIILPAGAVVELYISSLHRNPIHFPDPEKYDPDRFLPENVQLRHPFAFTPFSAGPRNCIGQKFALMEMKVLLVHLLRNFTWKSLQKPEEMDPAILIVLRPNNGVWIKFAERKL